MIDDLREIFVHLSINKMRTSLTGLSVSVGIFLLIILLGAGNGLINAFDANMGSVALDAIKVWPGVTSEPYNGLEKGREIKFDSRDPQLINRAFPERVHSVTAKNQQSGVKASYGNKMLSGTLNGCYPDNIEIDKIKVLYGRYLSQSDLDNQRKVIVISERSAEEFFTTAINALNKPLRIDSIVYHVVGVVSNKGIMGGFEGDIPYTSMQLLYRKGQNIEELILRTNGTGRANAPDKQQNKPPEINPTAYSYFFYSFRRRVLQTGCLPSLHKRRALRDEREDLYLRLGCCKSTDLLPYKSVRSHP